MKRTLVHLPLNICFIIGLHAAPVILDLSRSHTVEGLKKTDLTLHEITGGNDEQDFSFQNQEVDVLLPGGRRIRQNVELGIIDSKEGLLTRLSLTGGVMPQDQAYEVARIFIQSFGLPLDKLKEWKNRNPEGALRNDRFGASPVLRYFPIVSLGITPGANQLYPWNINFVVEWGWQEQRDWNEERVWRELPPPTLATISLNPPSGLKYDRRDAYKDTLQEQMNYEQSKSSLWLWIVVGILFFGVSGGTLLKVFRK